MRQVEVRSIFDEQMERIKLITGNPIGVFMSKSISHSSIPNSHPPDLTAIAATLTEAAQALQSFSSATLPQRKEAPDAAGETRCYYLSPATLRQERELLQKYRADDFHGLLTETHTLLAGLVKVMMSTHPDARLRGRSVSSLGASLEQVVTLLVRMRNIYDKMERIPA